MNPIILDISWRRGYVELDECVWSDGRRANRRTRENDRLRSEYERLKRDGDQQRSQLEREIERLRQESERLKRELDLARRAARRQAAPFSKGAPKCHPKRPGGKAHRPIPLNVDEEIVVPAPELSPCCNSEIENLHVEDQYQTEIVRKTHVTRFRIHVGCCVKCGPVSRQEFPVRPPTRLERLHRRWGRKPCLLRQC